MHCPHCSQHFDIKLAVKAMCKGCSLLTSMTTVMTVRCNNCGKMLQFPVQGKSMLAMKEEQE